MIRAFLLFLFISSVQLPAFAGNLAATWDFTGNVGIGTTIPSGMLDVNKKFQVLSTGATINNNASKQYSGSKTLSDNVATGIVQITVGSGEMIGGNLDYSLYVSGGSSDLQSHSGEVAFNCINKGGSVTSDIEEQYGPSAESEVMTAGTLSDVWSVTNGAGVCTLNITADTDLSTPTLTAKYDIELDSLNTITPQ